jgi:hypothetical protein
MRTRDWFFAAAAAIYAPLRHYRLAAFVMPLLLPPLPRFAASDCPITISYTFHADISNISPPHAAIFASFPLRHYAIFAAATIACERNAAERERGA